MKESPRKLKVFLPLLFSVVLALGMFIGFKLRDKEGYKAAYFLPPGRMSTLQEIISLIGLKYVDSVDATDMKKDAVQGILNHLDPHSVYIPPAQLAEVNEDLEGNFSGIGVEFGILKDTVNVMSVISGGPSETAGLQTGDKIIRVNDSLVAGNHITATRIKTLLRGPDRSTVRVTVLRGEELKPFTIRRGVIPLHSVDASYMIAEGIGYIRLNRFASNTYGEFMDAVSDLQKAGLKKLIIDLRQNPGGYLDAAVKIADELLDGRKLIVYTEGKQYPRTDYTCLKAGVFEKGPLAILVDEGSASASEILSGAVQDWDRGAIIGRRTFGKGLVQEQYALNDGGALRLTVARYYIPSGRCIQKPYADGREAYREDIMDRYEHGELTNADSTHFSDTTRYYTQVKHRRVYGGGGIMPDIFVSIDTARMNRLMSSLYSGNLFYDFAYQYYSHHTSDFASYHDATDFADHFIAGDELWSSFVRYAEGRGIRQMNHISPQDAKEAKMRIKALLARQRWNNNGFYQVMNRRDSSVLRAVETLRGESAGAETVDAP